MRDNPKENQEINFPFTKLTIYKPKATIIMTKKFFLLLFCAMGIAIAGQAQEKVSVQGNVNASDLPDNAKVELCGNTTLNMDVDKRLYYLSDHTTNFDQVYADLTITGSGKLSFSDNADGFSAIESCIRARTVVISENSTVEAVSKYKTHPVLEVHQLKVYGHLTATNNVTAVTAKNNIEVSGGILNVASSEYGIYSREGAVILDGTVMAIAADMAIYSKAGNVEIKGGTVECEATNRGIQAAGNIIISGGKVTAQATNGSTPIAIRAEQDFETSGNAEITTFGGNEGLNAKNITISGGKLTLSGKNAIIASNAFNITGGEVNAVSLGDYAIRGINSLSINGGIVTASSIVCKYGLHSNGPIALNKGTISVRGFVSAVQAGSGITLGSCTIQIPANGRVSGNTIVNANGNVAKKVSLSTILPPISGKVNITGVVCMQPVSYSLEGDIASVSASLISAQWQYTNDEYVNSNAVWYDIPGQTGTTYTPTATYLGKFIRVKVTAQGYSGYLSSPYGYVTKIPQNNTPSDITLQIANNQVRITNAVNYMEYIMLSSPKAVSSLTVSDWANSKTTTAALGSLDMGGTMGNTYYVYGRFKETDTFYAGSKVSTNSIYLGSSTALQSISFKVEMNIGGTGIKPEYTTDIEKDNDVYYAKKGNVFKLTIVPNPSEATFNGISGSRFFSNAAGGTFHSDFRGSMPLNASENYKVVYFKAGDQKNNVDVQAEYTKGYNDVIRAVAYFHIADANGNYAMNRIESVETTVDVGEKKEGISITTRPEKASLAGATAALRNSSGTGTAPIVTINSSTRTMSVDATSATEGIYYYDVYQNSQLKTNGTSIKVIVTGTALDDITITPAALKAEPGDEVELEAQLTPANATVPVAWSCTSYANVDNGRVKITPTAPRGNTITVTATAASRSAQCVITIPKLSGDLSVGQYDPIAYMGKSFAPPIINNPHGLSISYVSMDESVATVNSTTGAITLKGEGIATICVSSQENNTYEACQVSYQLMVMKNDPGLAFSVTEAKAELGKSFTPPTLSNPNGLTVKYTSAKPAVATVNATSGAVTLVGEGSTWITASFSGNDIYYNGSSAYELTVTKTSGIDDVSFGDMVPANSYTTVDGLRLQGKPARKGVYIVNGRKIIVK